ncbi:MAG: hypothetical protein R3C28_11165 [Pirellulaceae bacterium]
MDPDACFSMLLEHVADGEFDDAAELAESLQHWLRRGGFSPGGRRLRQASLDAFLAWVASRGNQPPHDLSAKGE